MRSELGTMATKHSFLLRFVSFLLHIVTHVKNTPCTNVLAINLGEYLEQDGPSGIQNVRCLHRPGVCDHDRGICTTAVGNVPGRILSPIILFCFYRMHHSLTGALAGRRALWPLRFMPLPFSTAEVASVDVLVSG